jgi:hypothetical protein
LSGQCDESVTQVDAIIDNVTEPTEVRGGKEVIDLADLGTEAARVLVVRNRQDFRLSVHLRAFEHEGVFQQRSVAADVRQRQTHLIEQLQQSHPGPDGCAFAGSASLSDSAPHHESIGNPLVEQVQEIDEPLRHEPRCPPALG